MRLIDADALELEGWYLSRHYIVDSKTECFETKAIKEVPTAQPTEVSCWGCNCTKMERLKEQKTFSEMVHLHDAERREE